MRENPTTAHGGKNCTPSPPETSCEIWVRVVHKKLNWTDAKQNCQYSGAKLFDDIDGTEAQLRILLQRTNYVKFFVGLWTEDGVTWRNGDGDIVPSSKLIWGGVNPSGDGNVTEVNNYGGKAALNDLGERQERISMCDLRN